MQSPIQHGPTRSWFHIRSGNQWGIQSEESRHICGWPSSWELPQPSSLIKGEGWFFKLRTVNVGFGFAKKTRCFRGLTTRHLLQPYSFGVTNPTFLRTFPASIFESFLYHFQTLKCNLWCKEQLRNKSDGRWCPISRKGSVQVSNVGNFILGRLGQRKSLNTKSDFLTCFI